MDLVQLTDYRRLKRLLDDDDADQILFYLSVPPGAAANIVDFLGQADMNSSRFRVLFEKPFGFDYESAKEFVERTGQYFKEEQLYRIDHYMAKEIAAEIIRMRRVANSKQHHWGAQTIKEVRVVASEAIGVGRGEGRTRRILNGQKHCLRLKRLNYVTEVRCGGT
jgi:glucose-6-phosphate 1-dehydrogenase